MRVTSTISYYLPGRRAGGPLRTLANMVERLGDDFAWSIITSDRDLGSTTPYPDTPTETWLRVGRAAVMYVPPRRQSARLLVDRVRALRPDVLYLNSLFNARLTLPLLALRRTSPHFRVPTIIAPRGVFAPAALARGRLKKTLFLHAASRAGLFRDVLWQASCSHEADDIRRVLGAATRIGIAPDLTHAATSPGNNGRPAKRPGKLRLVFLGRIAPIKNLHACLTMLEGLHAKVEFDVCGPIEDPRYWRRCQALAARLGANVAVRHMGVVAHDRVADMLAGYDGLLLPTLGENFGHAIVEALAAGCPAIISDRTPWRDLPRRLAGWDLPLENVGAFRAALSRLANMDEPEHASWRHGAQAFGRAVVGNAEDLERNRQLLFAAAAASSHSTRRRAA
jgi:glycosyltransferase involved in cell wall biosynthesis